MLCLNEAIHSYIILSERAALGEGFGIHTGERRPPNLLSASMESSSRVNGLIFEQSKSISSDEVPAKTFSYLEWALAADCFWIINAPIESKDITGFTLTAQDFELFITISKLQKWCSVLFVLELCAASFKYSMHLCPVCYKQRKSWCL